MIVAEVVWTAAPNDRTAQVAIVAIVEGIQVVLLEYAGLTEGRSKESTVSANFWTDMDEQASFRLLPRQLFRLKALVPVLPLFV